MPVNHTGDSFADFSDYSNGIADLSDTTLVLSYLSVA